MRSWPDTGNSLRERVVTLLVALAIGTGLLANGDRSAQLRLATTGTAAEAIVVRHEPCRAFGTSWCPHDDDRAWVGFGLDDGGFTIRSIRVRELPPVGPRVLVRYDPAHPERVQLAEDPPDRHWVVAMITTPLFSLLFAAALLARPARERRAKRLGERGDPRDHAVRVDASMRGRTGLRRTVASCS